MKYCPKCGSPCEDNARFCDKCGGSFAAAQSPPQNTGYPPQGAGYQQQAPGYPQQNPGYPQQGYGYQQQAPGYPQQNPGYPQQGQGYAPPGFVGPYEGYRKMGGWLLFFVICGILGIVMNIVTLFREVATYSENAGLLRAVSGSIKTALNLALYGQIIIALGVVFQIVFIVNIFQRKPPFLRFYQISAIVLLCASIISFFIPAGMIGFDAFAGNVMSQVVSGLIGSIVGFFLLTYYYCKSRRVRTYMGSDEYMAKALFSYKQPPLNWN